MLDVTTSCNRCCLIAGYDFERQRVLRTIPSSDFVPTTGFDGQRAVSYTHLTLPTRRTV